MIEAGNDFNFLKQKVKDIGEEQAGQWIIDGIESKADFVSKLRVKDMYEALHSTVFPKAVGALIHKYVIDAYDITPTIGDQLVTTVPSNKKTETIVGFTAAETPELVPEGTPYQDSSIGEKYVTIDNNKYGRTISITEETVMFDQTGQIINRCQDIGEKAALFREKQIIEAVCDLGTTSKYKPSGTAASFYSSTNGNTVSVTTPTSASALASVKDLMDSQTDSEGDPILINRAGLIWLVPAGMEVAAWTQMNSQQVTGSGNNDPNYWSGTYKILSSPFCSTSTEAYIGDFKRDWWWTQVYPLQVMRHVKPSEANFSRDVIAQFKVRYYGGVGAVDYRHCYQMT
jgi:hypothetical protein